MVEASEPEVKQLFQGLLSKSVQPYLTILKKWIFQGVLDDPFSEFIIKEDRSQNKENIANDFSDKYWTEKWSFNNAMVPIFLERYK